MHVARRLGRSQPLLAKIDNDNLGFSARQVCGRALATCRLEAARPPTSWAGHRRPSVQPLRVVHHPSRVEAARLSTRRVNNGQSLLRLIRSLRCCQPHCRAAVTSKLPGPQQHVRRWRIPAPWMRGWRRPRAMSPQDHLLRQHCNQHCRHRHQQQTHQTSS